MVDDLKKATAPNRYMSQVAWATTLGGDGPTDRKIIHKYSSFGGEDSSNRFQDYVSVDNYVVRSSRLSN